MLSTLGSCDKEGVWWRDKVIDLCGHGEATVETSTGTGVKDSVVFRTIVNVKGNLSHRKVYVVM